MPSDRVQIEIGFTGRQIVAALVPTAAADGLARALEDGGIFRLEADDGEYVIPVTNVLYVRRVSRETPIGFGGRAR